MDIMKQLSIRNLKLNKKRTVSTIIGIILSVALICAVATLATSFQATLVQNAINETGYYHIKLLNINDSNMKELKNNRDIKDIYTIEQNGYAKLENGQNYYKPYLRVYSMDKNSFEYLSFDLIEGRFPQNNNEIVISKHIETNAKVKYKIGDKIKINIGQRKTLDNYILDSSNTYNKEDEKLVDTNEHEFTIVGIMQRPDYNFEDYSDPGYTVITTDMNIGQKEAYIVLKNPKDYKTSIVELLGASNYDKISKETNLKYNNFDINNELLRWEVFAFSDSTLNMLYTVVGVVIVIIIFTSVFCIRNSFAISIIEKIKMYGMLASVGATKKQIKKSVIFEAFILGIIGIPIGILSGIFAVFVLIKIVNMLLGDYLLAHVDGIVMSISITPILISIVLGYVTIFLSAISSARRASKVSPIEQLRNSDEIKIKNKNLKTPKIISKLFKTGGILAYKNLKRSKKKYRTTVISLSVSIFIFIAMNAFITNMFDFTGNYYEDYDYNLKAYCREDFFTEEELNKILSLNNIQERFIVYQEKNREYIKIKDLSKINQIEGIELLEDSYYDEEQEKEIPTGEGKVSALEMIALDNATFKKYAKKIGVNYEKVKSTGILCDVYTYVEEQTDKIKNDRRYTYKENDTITGKYKENEINIKVGAVTDIRPFGFEQIYYAGGYLILNVDEFKNIDFAVEEISIQSDKPDNLQEEIEKIDNARVRNLDSEVKEQKSMILVINIFLYGFIAVITLIGVTNIFNTITSNMELRQKEFAMLKSIGMTKREFNRMINLETLFYGTKSLVYGIILGLIGTFAMYKAFSIKLESGVYIPVKPILLSIVFVFILVYIIMKYSISKVNKQNTIETIRKENV